MTIYFFVPLVDKILLQISRGKSACWLVLTRKWKQINYWANFHFLLGLASNTVLFLCLHWGWYTVRYKVQASEELTFVGGGTLRLCVFSCRWGGSVMGGSMPDSFIPGEAPSLTGATEDSWPEQDWGSSPIHTVIKITAQTEKCMSGKDLMNMVILLWS